MSFPDFKFEIPLWKNGYSVIGIDEVGRGALAGPLVVGAVCFKPQLNTEGFMRLLSLGINDSKKLLPAKREILSSTICKESLCYSFGEVSVSKINKIGITKATQSAIRQAVSKIIYKINKPFVLADAFYTKYLVGVGMKRQKAIIKGDTLSISIAAASIIAKVYRDNLMEKLGGQYPDYQWDVNKGYGTTGHREAIQTHGINVHHRELFVRKILLQ